MMSKFEIRNYSFPVIPDHLTIVIPDLIGDPRPNAPFNTLFVLVPVHLFAWIPSQAENDKRRRAENDKSINLLLLPRHALITHYYQAK